jgi:hypothetical protein
MSPPATAEKLQPADSQPPAPQTERVTIPSDACGICHKKTRNSGEKRSDSVMLQCDISTCNTWYHLSCIQWVKPERQILLSLTMGTKRFDFICAKCLGLQAEHYTNEVSRAVKNLKFTIETIKNRVYDDSDATPEACMYEPPALEKYNPSLGANAYGLEDGPGMLQFALTRDEKFQGFEQSRIIWFLREIDQVVYSYDREVCWTRKILRDGSNSYIENPLQNWDTIDAGQEFTEGSEWFNLHDYTNIASTSHHPITAALRLLLKTPSDQKLAISSELGNITFSQVHMSLIYWFILDILSDKRNMYELPNMKPMRAMMAAVANFGDTSTCPS